MGQRLILGGIEAPVLRQLIQDALVQTEGIRVAGVASAFVTVRGVEALREVFEAAGVADSRLIAGLDGEITHPAALRLARNNAWDVRAGQAPNGRFHPKLIVAGDGFTRDGDVDQPKFVYVGSANVTESGLVRNAEAGLVANTPDVISRVDVLFGPLWRTSRRLGERDIRAYEARFAERNRYRSPETLEALGVTDDPNGPPRDPREARFVERYRRATFSEPFAVGAWAGLEVFTGEYTFQVEFPRLAGQVIRRLAGHELGDRVEVYCEDEQIRPMKYRFYEDNGMFRLNVPNSVPGVEWVRGNRTGMALVERGPEGGAELRLRILRPGSKAEEIQARSIMLGTWGSTGVRLYGWY